MSESNAKHPAIHAYPQNRPPYFAHRYCRLLTKTCAAQEIGHDESHYSANGDWPQKHYPVNGDRDGHRGGDRCPGS
jgi:hypothetical protein